jgi:cation transport ATPase
LKKSIIEVDGVCGMCKARIEKTSLKIKGVKSASWSTDTHQLTLIYDTSKASLDSIQKQIARVGHNTPLFKAPDEAYEALPMCCKYKTVEDH